MSYTFLALASFDIENSFASPASLHLYRTVDLLGQFSPSNQPMLSVRILFRWQLTLTKLPRKSRSSNDLETFGGALASRSERIPFLR